MIWIWASESGRSIPNSNVNADRVAANANNDGRSEIPLLDFSEPEAWPVDWKEQKIETEYFEVHIPASMTGGRVDGEDTSLWHFKDKKLEFHIEYGGLGGDHTEHLYGANKNEVEINGEPATVALGDLNKRDPHAAVNADGSTKSKPIAKGKVLVAYFKNKHANFALRASDEGDLSIGRVILQSITFK